MQIEARRKEKLFGTSLGAQVVITASGDDLALLRKYESSLPMLFIVSDVRVPEGADAVDRDGESGRASSATGAGVMVPSVASDADHQGLCDRCVDALAEPVGS